MVTFRTKYSGVVDDARSFEPGTSVCQPGRSESVQHIVQRLTRKPNPTSRDLYVISQQTGQAFEDPSKLTDAELDDRFERVVTQADQIDAAEALLDAQADLAQSELLARTGANAGRGSESGENVVKAKTNETQTAEQSPVSGFATEAQQPIRG